MNFVMRSKGWEQRKKIWSCKSKQWILEQLTSSILPLHCQLHLQHKGKWLVTSWCLSLVILALPCGSSCRLQPSTYHRITCSAHQLLKRGGQMIWFVYCAVMINNGFICLCFFSTMCFIFNCLRSSWWCKNFVWRLADDALLTLYKIKGTILLNLTSCCLQLCFLISVIVVHKF